MLQPGGYLVCTIDDDFPIYAHEFAELTNVFQTYRFVATGATGLTPDIFLFDFFAPGSQIKTERPTELFGALTAMKMLHPIDVSQPEPYPTSIQNDDVSMSIPTASSTAESVVDYADYEPTVAAKSLQELAITDVRPVTPIEIESFILPHSSLATMFATTMD
nr:unnamed protein product [Haemonchus contortus]